MSIIKNNNIRIEEFNIENNKVFINGIKVRKGDVICYRCDRCGHIEEIKFRSHKEFINDKIICSACLRKQTNFSKYGFESISQSPIIQEKIKENSRKKYGTDHFLAAKEIRSKINKTNKERYGTENILQSDKIKEKSEKTMIRKYGVKYSLQSDDIKKKFNQSMIDKYGTQYAMHSFQIKEKRRTSMQSGIERKIFDFVHIKPMFTKEEFMGINKFYKWQCHECHFTFEDHLDYGHIPRCPRCNPKKVKVNRKKQELIKWLTTILKIENVVVDDKTTISPYDLSVYLPDYHIGIEFLSLYWNSESQGKDKDYQITKSSLCAGKNIKLISIFEDEWALKQKIIKSIIKRILGLLGKTINARDCNIVEITNKDASTFYTKNHIQGHVNSKINYGLMHHVEGLVSCFSTSTPRFNHNYNWEIIRFANRLNINIIDSFDKFLKYFQKNHNGSIIVYGDCRYFDSDIYGKNGFTHLSRSEPNYFYTNYNDRHNRLKFQKKRLKNKIKHFDEELTEWQNMQMNGYDRIWDCGSNVYTID